jgi:hypothetical protein
MPRLVIRLTALAVAVAALTACRAAADPITFHVHIDSSGFAGTSGSLEIQFNPASTSNGVTATITGFAGGTPGAIDNPLPNGGGVNPIGDISGSLPGTVTLDDGTPFNDMVQNFTYGSAIDFNVTFSKDLAGAALDGSAFSLFLWDTPDGAFGPGNPNTFLQAPGFNPFGDALLLNDGGPSGTGPAPTDQHVTVAAVSSVPVPEPTSLWLLGLGVGGLLVWRRRRAA